MNVTQHRIILASASPRRRELLGQAGVDFEIIVSGCDETPIQQESAQDMVERLALSKAAAVADHHLEAFVIGADTTVFIDGISLGKPESESEAHDMLARIAGRTHEVWGGIAIVQRAKKINQVWSHVTQVTMAAMTKAEIERYVRTGEPMDKAGAYAIQGIGLQFVDTVQGSYSNVVGLNISALMEKLKQCGAVR